MDLTFFTHTNLKMGHRPMLKCKTTKLLYDDTGENLADLEYGDDFLDTIPEA